jgi:hypothetical protein
MRWQSYVRIMYKTAITVRLSPAFHKGLEGGNFVRNHTVRQAFTAKYFANRAGVLEKTDLTENVRQESKRTEKWGLPLRGKDMTAFR